MQVTIQGDEKPVLLAEQRVGRLAPSEGRRPLCLVLCDRNRVQAQWGEGAAGWIQAGPVSGSPCGHQTPPSPFQWAVEENALLVGELARLLRVGYQGSGMCHRS